MVWKHPTGLVLPVGLPIRILAKGQYVSSATAAFQQDYCSAPSHATDPRCAVGSFTYTIHGLADGPGVMRPYEAGMGLALTWLHIAGYYERFYGPYPSAEFFRGRVPAADTASVREVHFSRNGCCYYNSWGTTAVWETYEGSWRFGAVPDDGGQAELGVPPVLRLRGPRTDAPMTASAEFTVATATGDSVMANRWWYVHAANNTFDGEPVPLVTITQPWTMQIPRYPDGQRAVFEELAECAGRRTCTYQAMAAGAVLVQATLGDGRVLAARNIGASGAYVKITVDSTTLTYGDTTVFRVTAPGAGQWAVTGYSFVPVSVAAESAVHAVRETSALRRAGVSARQSDHTQRPMASQPAAQPSSPAAQTAETPAGVTVVRGRTKAHFLDAAVACGEALVELCYDDPPQTGYEIVTAVVDGEVQRDSVLVTVVPLVVIERAGGPNEHGSFLTAVIKSERPENVIKLKARVAPASLAPSVTWEIVQLDSLVRTVPPDSVPRGASTSFVVPAGSNRSPNGIHWIHLTPRDSIVDRGRWPLHHPANSGEKLAQLGLKALGYRITAIVTAGGQTVRSSPVTVQQDEKDVMREEYVDFGWPIDSIPGRDSLQAMGPPERNLKGDYQYWITGQRLNSLMPVMTALSLQKWDFSPVIMSGYRNPVHHFVHAKAKATRSQHLTGNATDWRIVESSSRPSGFTADTWFTELFHLTRDTTVNGCWEPSKAIKDGSSDGRTLDHAHSDWRNRCPAKWTKRD